MSEEARQHDMFLNIPDELKEIPQWVCWTHEERNDKSTKVLKQINGFNAAVDKPASWNSFSACVQASKNGKFSGIGFVLTENDPYGFIDLDAPEDDEEAQTQLQIYEEFESYAERSPSGEGLHILIRGSLPKGKRKGKIELYSSGRYMTVTGDVFRVAPIVDCNEKFNSLYERLGGGKIKSEDSPISFDANVEPNYEIADNAAHCQNKLGKLWRKELSEFTEYKSASEADLALIAILRWECASDAEAMATALRSPLLARHGPDAKRKAVLCMNRLAHETEEVEKWRQAKAVAEELSKGVVAKIKGLIYRVPNGRRFRLLRDADLDLLPPQGWLVKGIIPEKSVGTIFGPSGTFKSFLGLDLLAHISSGINWFGQRVKAAPCVYVPFEGVGGIPKRVAAWRSANKRESSNVAFITEPMNLRESLDRDALVATLKEGGWAGGVLCIDTLAQAGAGIDENSSEGMGEMIAIFQELQQRLECTVLVVHHSGKDDSRGMRGWSGLRGALDFSIKCRRDETWGTYEAQFVLDKVKDDSGNKTFTFLMNRIVIGADEDGDEISSLAVTNCPNAKEQKEPAIDLAERDKRDEEFVLKWIRRLISENIKPPGRYLESTANSIKAEYDITNLRIRSAVTRLKGQNELFEAQEGKHKWLSPTPPEPLPALAC